MVPKAEEAREIMQDYITLRKIEMKLVDSNHIVSRRWMRNLSGNCCLYGMRFNPLQLLIAGFVGNTNTDYYVTCVLSFHY